MMPTNISGWLVGCKGMISGKVHFSEWHPTLRQAALSIVAYRAACHDFDIMFRLTGPWPRPESLRDKPAEKETNHDKA